MKMENNIEAMVFGAVNNEFKSLLLGFVLDARYRTSWEIKNSAVELAGSDTVSTDEKTYERSVYDPRRQKLSLEPFVEVSYHQSGRRRTRMFRLNQDAERTEIADIARFMMYSTIKFEMSTWEWLGQNINDGPLSTVRLIEELRSNGGRKRSDLEKSLEMSGSAINSKLNKLFSLDIIQFDSFRKGDITYLKNGKTNSFNNNFKHPAVSKKIFRFLETIDGRFSYEDVMGITGYVDRSRVQSTLRAMERKGYIRSETSFVGGMKYSDISISPRGAKLHSDVIEPVLLMIREKDSGAMEYVRRKAIYRENIQTALRTYNSIKPSSKKQSSATREAEILEMLSHGQMKYSDIEHTVGVRAAKYISRLIEKGRIHRNSRGIYSLR